MAYDTELAERILRIVEGELGLSEKKMFGGLAFLIDGHMAVAASGQGGMLLRIDPDDTESLVDGEQVSRMQMHGREMDGWLRVAAEAVATDDELRRWVALGVDHVRTLPPK